MSEYERAGFYFLCMGDEREKIVEQIDQVLQKRGLNIIRNNSGSEIQALRKQTRCGQP